VELNADIVTTKQIISWSKTCKFLKILQQVKDFHYCFYIPLP